MKNIINIKNMRRGGSSRARDTTTQDRFSVNTGAMLTPEDEMSREPVTGLGKSVLKQTKIIKRGKHKKDKKLTTDDTHFHRRTKSVAPIGKKGGFSPNSYSLPKIEPGRKQYSISRMSNVYMTPGDNLKSDSDADTSEMDSEMRRVKDLEKKLYQENIFREYFSISKPTNYVKRNF